MNERMNCVICAKGGDHDSDSPLFTASPPSHFVKPNGALTRKIHIAARQLALFGISLCCFPPEHRLDCTSYYAQRVDPIPSAGAGEERQHGVVGEEVSLLPLIIPQLLQPIKVRRSNRRATGYTIRVAPI
jgi:hypothetical protein